MTTTHTSNPNTEKERIIKFAPAYDKRDPDPSKDYGIHGVTLTFVLKGAEGAVDFVLYTNWMLPHVQEEQDGRMSPGFVHLMCHPIPADLGYHSPRPIREWQDGGAPSQAECNWLGAPCWYDGSTLNAEPVYRRLLEEGDEGVWAELEDYYAQTFRKASSG